jgi:hypothetical protein
MSFLNKINIQIFQVINKKLKENPSFKFDGDILEKIIKIDKEDSIHESFINILQNVVYFVVNITDMKSQGERKFTTGLNWDILDDVVRKGNYIKESFINEYRNKIIPDTESAIALYSLNKSPTSVDEAKEKILKQWNAVWNEYYYLTKQNESKKLWTFNQWLLKHVDNPINIGVYWGDENHKADNSYCYLGKIKFDELSLDLPQDNWKEKFERVFHSSFNTEDIESKFRSMYDHDKKDNDKIDFHLCTKFALYYLLRSYGFWGGNAFYSVPINYGKGRYSGILSICTLGPMDEDLVHRWTLVANKLFREVSLNELHKFEEYATKAAISQVMARNMSHNIGSHVLAKLGTVQHIQNIKDETNKESMNIKKDILEREDNGSEPDEKFYPRKTAHCVANFNSYLRARMDYLADIATSSPVLENNKGFFREILQGFFDNPVLLNRISGVESFPYEIKLFDCRNGGQKEVNKNTQDDIIVSVPNDILGCHAFYVILENIIRNSAKHGKGEGNRPSEIKIEIGNCEDNSLYEVLIYDDLGKDEVECNALVGNINKKNNEGVLDKEGKLRQGYWGQIEMACSSAYLRKIPIENINDREKISNIIEAFRTKDRCLGYRLFLMKPKNYLIVGDFSIEEERRKELVTEGILILKPDEFNPGKEIYAHQFLLYDNDNIQQKIDENLASLPSRRKKLDNNIEQLVCSLLINGKNKNGKSIAVQIDEIIWPHWGKSFLGQHNVKKVNVAGGLEQNNGEYTKLNKPFTFENGKPNGSEFSALLLNHGHNWDEYKNKFKNNEKGFVDYAEPFSSQTKSVLPNYNSVDDALTWNSDGLNDITKSKISESIIAKIGVIDERVQEAKEKLDYPAEKGIKIPYRCIYSMTNIVIPDASRVNLNKQNFITFENGEKSVKEELEDWFTDNIPNLDALIIHLGVLEKVLKGEKNKNGESEDEKMISYIKEKIKNFNTELILIITSGRGQPHNLPIDERFVNLSSVLDCLVENRSKYKLNNLVFSARKLKK